MEDGRFQKMSEILIQSSQISYPIIFDRQPITNSSQVFYLIDSKISDEVIRGLENKFVIEANEKNKNLGTCEEIIQKMAKMRITKNHKLIAIGGGFIQDLATMVASIYMRGIPWEFYPSTLAAMGDSCIGGKSSINSGNFKNLIGNFYPPVSVKINSTFAHTLPKIEIVAGLAEIIKICFAAGEKEFLTCLDYLIESDYTAESVDLDEIIALSLNCKKRFVEEDEFDQGIRKLLNFGHSFSHAIESGTNFQIQHGIGVAIGMLCAMNHPSAVQSSRTAELQKVCIKLLSTVKLEFLSNIESLDYDNFELALRADKKNTKENLVLVLPTKDGLGLQSILFEKQAVLEASRVTKSTIDWITSEIF